MITERHQAAGHFKVSLDPDTPRSVTDAISDFGLLTVTPVHLPPTAGLATTALLDVASYTGVITDRRAGQSGRRTELHGKGLAYLLGTNDGLSDMFTANALTTGQTVGYYVTNHVLKNASTGTNGIRYGSTSNSTVGIDIERVPGMSPLEVLNRAVEIADDGSVDDWRIRPNLLLDVTDSTALFPEFSSTSVVFTRGGSRQPGRQTYAAENLDPRSDVDDLTTRVIVIDSTGSTGAHGSTAGSTKYYVLGDQLRRERVLEPSDLIGNSTVMAKAVKTAYDFPADRINVSIDGNDWVHEVVEPGSYVGVWDEPTGFPVDAPGSTTATAHVNGETIWPKSIRVQTLQWPLRPGMGVYAVSSTSTGSTYVDVTDWVRWESGNAKVSLGDPPRKILTAKPGGRSQPRTQSNA